MVVPGLIWRSWFAFAAAEVEAATEATAQIAACNQATEEEERLERERKITFTKSNGLSMQQVLDLLY